MESDDFRMRYNLYIEDIKYIKARQWTVTYYILSLIAAIITFYGLLRHLSSSSDVLTVWKVILCILGSAFAFMGTYFHMAFQKDLQGYRIKVYEAFFHLSKPFQAYEMKDPEKYLSLEKDLEFTAIFVALLWLGAGIVYFTLAPYQVCVVVSALGIWLLPFVIFWLCFKFLNKREKCNLKSDRSLVLCKAMDIKDELAELRRTFLTPQRVRDASPEKPHPTACP